MGHVVLVASLVSAMAVALLVLIALADIQKILGWEINVARNYITCVLGVGGGIMTVCTVLYASRKTSDSNIRGFLPSTLFCVNDQGATPIKLTLHYIIPA